MRFDIEITNAIIGVAWAIVTFLLGGMIITRKRR